MPFDGRLLAGVGVQAGQIGSFIDRHPDIFLELVNREPIGDPVADGIDVAMRFGQPAQSSLVGRKLADVRVLTVASPAHLEAFIAFALQAVR